MSSKSAMSCSTPSFVTSVASLSQRTTHDTLRTCSWTCYRLHTLSRRPSRRRLRRELQTGASMTASLDLAPLGLTPRLEKTVLGFRDVPDPRLRYQQLLFMAKSLPPMDDRLKIDANKVPGCLSVVHVHAKLDEEKKVVLEGDSDAQLTKGLIALLIEGLQGATPEQVLAVNPQFIAASRLNVSLTPGRNSGFLNMLRTIKSKVSELVSSEGNGIESNGNPGNGKEGAEENGGGNGGFDEIPGRPVYSAIMKKLRLLKPVKLEVDDDSAKHAGHAGSRGFNGESHFSVRIVADAFESLSLVKRHKLIYTLLDEEFRQQKLHALSIDAKTPSEVKPN